MLRLRRVALSATGIVAGVTALAALLQWIWAGWSVYSGPGPSLALRWLLTGAVGAALLLPPGAAMVGAAVGRRIADAGLRDQVRVTQRGALHLALRSTGWALAAPLVAAALSAAGWIGVSVAHRLGAVAAGDLPSPGAIGLAHTIALIVAAAFAVWGLERAAHDPSRTTVAPSQRAVIPRTIARSGLWAPVVLATLVAGPALVGPLLPYLARPEWALNAALLVNPVTAIGAALGMDVLRSPHVYHLTRAPEYWYAYPPAAATVGIYLVLAAAGITALQRRFGRE